MQRSSSSIDDALNLLDPQQEFESPLGGLSVPVLAVSFLQFRANSWLTPRNFGFTYGRHRAVPTRYGADEGGEA
jgi:hypothetical protein